MENPNTMQQIKFKDKITYLRERAMLTKEELSSVLGISTATVTKYENGESIPATNILVLLAAYFDIGVDELLAYELKEARSIDRRTVKVNTMVRLYDYKRIEAIAKERKISTMDVVYRMIRKALEMEGGANNGGY